MSENHAHPTPAAGVCPLCGGPNDCAMACASGDTRECWCMGVNFPTSLLAQATDAGPYCVCRKCANAGQTDGATDKG